MQLRKEQNHSICFPLKHVNKITSAYFCSYIENCTAAIFFFIKLKRLFRFSVQIENKLENFGKNPVNFSTQPPIL